MGVIVVAARARMTHATPGFATRIQDIEGLRAIAALSVLIGHVPWLRVGSERLLGIPLDPWTGVDLFFVISGFVVSRAFERDLVRAGGGAICTARPSVRSI
jgi:peptidoglycan/LPS O-acetylase OafA/YrhL